MLLVKTYIVSDVICNLYFLLLGSLSPFRQVNTYKLFRLFSDDYDKI